MQSNKNSESLEILFPTKGRELSETQNKDLKKLQRHQRITAVVLGLLAAAAIGGGGFLIYYGVNGISQAENFYIIGGILTGTGIFLLLCVAGVVRSSKKMREKLIADFNKCMDIDHHSVLNTLNEMSANDCAEAVQKIVNFAEFFKTVEEAYSKNQEVKKHVLSAINTRLLNVPLQVNNANFALALVDTIDIVLPNIVFDYKDVLDPNKAKPIATQELIIKIADKLPPEKLYELASSYPKFLECMNTQPAIAFIKWLENNDKRATPEIINAFATKTFSVEHWVSLLDKALDKDREVALNKVKAEKLLQILILKPDWISKLSIQALIEVCKALNLQENYEKTFCKKVAECLEKFKDEEFSHALLLKVLQILDKKGVTPKISARGFLCAFQSTSEWHQIKTIVEKLPTDTLLEVCARMPNLIVHLNEADAKRFITGLSAQEVKVYDYEVGEAYFENLAYQVEKLTFLNLPVLNKLINEKKYPQIDVAKYIEILSGATENECKEIFNSLPLIILIAICYEKPEWIDRLPVISSKAFDELIDQLERNQKNCNTLRIKFFNRLSKWIAKSGYTFTPKIVRLFTTQLITPDLDVNTFLNVLKSANSEEFQQITKTISIDKLVEILNLAPELISDLDGSLIKKLAFEIMILNGQISPEIKQEGAKQLQKYKAALELWARRSKSQSKVVLDILAEDILETNRVVFSLTHFDDKKFNEFITAIDSNSLLQICNSEPTLVLRLPANRFKDLVHVLSIELNAIDSDKTYKSKLNSELFKNMALRLESDDIEPSVELLAMLAQHEISPQIGAKRFTAVLAKDMAAYDFAQIVSAIPMTTLIEVCKASGQLIEKLPSDVFQKLVSELHEKKDTLAFSENVVSRLIPNAAVESKLTDLFINSLRLADQAAFSNLIQPLSDEQLITLFNQHPELTIDKIFGICLFKTILIQSLPPKSFHDLIEYVSKNNHLINNEFRKSFFLGIAQRLETSEENPSILALSLLAKQGVSPQLSSGRYATILKDASEEEFNKIISKMPIEKIEEIGEQDKQFILRLDSNKIKELVIDIQQSQKELKIVFYQNLAAWVKNHQQIPCVEILTLLANKGISPELSIEMIFNFIQERQLPKDQVDNIVNVLKDKEGYYKLLVQKYVELCNQPDQDSALKLEKMQLVKTILEQYENTITLEALNLLAKNDISPSLTADKFDTALTSADPTQFKVIAGIISDEGVKNKVLMTKGCGYVFANLDDQFAAKLPSSFLTKMIQWISKDLSKENVKLVLNQLSHIQKTDMTLDLGRAILEIINVWTPEEFETYAVNLIKLLDFLGGADAEARRTLVASSGRLAALYKTVSFLTFKDANEFKLFLELNEKNLDNAFWGRHKQLVLDHVDTACVIIKKYSKVFDQLLPDLIQAKQKESYYLDLMYLKPDMEQDELKQKLTANPRYLEYNQLPETYYYVWANNGQLAQNLTKYNIPSISKYLNNMTSETKEAFYSSLRNSYKLESLNEVKDPLRELILTAYAQDAKNFADIVINDQKKFMCDIKETVRTSVYNLMTDEKKAEYISELISDAGNESASIINEKHPIYPFFKARLQEANVDGVLLLIINKESNSVIKKNLVKEYCSQEQAKPYFVKVSQ